MQSGGCSAAATASRRSSRATYSRSSSRSSSLTRRRRTRPSTTLADIFYRSPHFPLHEGAIGLISRVPFALRFTRSVGRRVICLLVGEGSHGLQRFPLPIGDG